MSSPHDSHTLPITASQVTIDPRLEALNSSNDPDLAQFAESLCTLLTLLTLKSRNFTIYDPDSDPRVLFVTEAARREYRERPSVENTKEYDHDIKDVVKEIQKNPVYKSTGKEFKSMIKGSKSFTSWWNNGWCSPDIIWYGVQVMQEEFALGPEGWKK